MVSGNREAEKGGEMNDKGKPTDEQSTRFFEWCGFRKFGWINWNFYCPPDKEIPDRIPVGAGVTREFQREYELPSIDGIEALGFLFKYAVPKVLEKIGRYELVVLVNNAVCAAVESGGEIAHALFWACDRVREAERVTI
ncbi:hypothetical protein LCGC14_0369950 [marine sediment metagenome]|uniref:Uncharacterized protein n=1 Tax=marine sediment metagenome TaxID=412755 RepID=A0A0F9VSP5_9ZZZZ